MFRIFKTPRPLRRSEIEELRDHAISAAGVALDDILNHAETVAFIKKYNRGTLAHCMKARGLCNLVRDEENKFEAHTDANE
jgi:hypothetical protein